jgi:hypothetical protein
MCMKEKTHMKWPDRPVGGNAGVGALGTANDIHGDLQKEVGPPLQSEAKTMSRPALVNLGGCLATLGLATSETDHLRIVRPAHRGREFAFSQL